MSHSSLSSLNDRATDPSINTEGSSSPLPIDKRPTHPRSAREIIRRNKENITRQLEERPREVIDRHRQLMKENMRRIKEREKRIQEEIFQRKKDEAEALERIKQEKREMYARFLRDASSDRAEKRRFDALPAISHGPQSRKPVILKRANTQNEKDRIPLITRPNQPTTAEGSSRPQQKEGSKFISDNNVQRKFEKLPKLFPISSNLDQTPETEHHKEAPQEQEEIFETGDFGPNNNRYKLNYEDRIPQSLPKDTTSHSELEDQPSIAKKDLPISHDSLESPRTSESKNLANLSEHESYVNSDQDVHFSQNFDRNSLNKLHDSSQSRKLKESYRKEQVSGTPRRDSAKFFEWGIDDETGINHGRVSLINPLESEYLQENMGLSYLNKRATPEGKKLIPVTPKRYRRSGTPNSKISDSIRFSKQEHDFAEPATSLEKNFKVISPKAVKELKKPGSAKARTLPVLADTESPEGRPARTMDDVSKKNTRFEEELMEEKMRLLNQIEAELQREIRDLHRERYQKVKEIEQKYNINVAKQSTEDIINEYLKNKAHELEKYDNRALKKNVKSLETKDQVQKDEVLKASPQKLQAHPEHPHRHHVIPFIDYTDMPWHKPHLVPNSPRAYYNANRRASDPYHDKYYAQIHPEPVVDQGKVYEAYGYDPEVEIDSDRRSHEDNRSPSYERMRKKFSYQEEREPYPDKSYPSVDNIIENEPSFFNTKTVESIEFPSVDARKDESKAKPKPTLKTLKINKPESKDFTFSEQQALKEMSQLQIKGIGVNKASSKLTPEQRALNKPSKKIEHHLQRQEEKKNLKLRPVQIEPQKIPKANLIKDTNLGKGKIYLAPNIHIKDIKELLAKSRELGK